MRCFSPHIVFAAIGYLVLMGVSAARADETIPSFKTDKDRETKEFVTKVASAIIKAARLKPQNIEVEKYEYTKPKTGRRDLKVKAVYHGLFTKKKYTSDIVVILDSSDSSKWEVLNITYKDTNPNVAKPNSKNIQELIPKFNK